MIARRFAPAPAVTVWPDRRGHPRGLRWRGRARQVEAVEASWRQQTGWWPGPEAAISRAYHQVRTRDGLRCVVYRDRSTRQWYLEAILA